MGGGKKIHESHVDYQEYVEKCQALQAKYQPLFDAEEERRKAECPNWMNCRDVLETAEKKRLYTQMHQELKILQKEYAHLFTEEIPDDQNHP